MCVKKILGIKSKKSCIGPDEKIFMDEEINQPIMVRSAFCGTFLKFKVKKTVLPMLGSANIVNLYGKRSEIV